MDQGNDVLRRFLNGEKLRESDWQHLLVQEDEWENWADELTQLTADIYHDWQSLDGYAWCHLLTLNPALASCCDWSKLDGLDWACLLAERPEFADKCDKWNEFGGREWSGLLREQPQFADKCDWSKFNGSKWAYLLEKQPQFADKCDWEKLDEGSNWAELLSMEPQFADKCDWSKLCGPDWERLLRMQPQFADKCDWSKLDGMDWAWLLEKQPQFANIRSVMAAYAAGSRKPRIRLSVGSIVCRIDDEFMFEDRGDFSDTENLHELIDDLRKMLTTLPPKYRSEIVENGIEFDLDTSALAKLLQSELSMQLQ